MNSEIWQTEYQRALGRRIRAARGDMTQRELSVRLATMNVGILVSAISEIERGKRRVTVEELLALALALRVPPTRLLVDGDEGLTVGRTEMSADQADAWVAGKLPPPGYSPFDEYAFLYTNQSASRRALLDQTMEHLRARSAPGGGGLPESMHGVSEPGDWQWAIGRMLDVEYVRHGTMFGQRSSGSLSQDELAARIGMDTTKGKGEGE